MVHSLTLIISCLRSVSFDLPSDKSGPKESKETLLGGDRVTEYNLLREMLIKPRSQLSRFKDKLSHNIYLVHSIVF